MGNASNQTSVGVTMASQRMNKEYVRKNAKKATNSMPKPMIVSHYVIPLAKTESALSQILVSAIKDSSRWM